MWNNGYSGKQDFVLSSNCFCTSKSETEMKVYLLNPMIKMQIQKLVVILASCMNHKMNELLYQVWIRNLRHPVEIRKFFATVAIHPVIYFLVSRVSKKISFKDNMECIAILRHSWMIHDTFWRKQIGRTSYFWTKSDAKKDGSVMKCIFF